MTKTLILTPNKQEVCGMYQLAKDLAKEFDGDIITKNDVKEWWKNGDWSYNKIYEQVITLLYPMHYYGKMLRFHHGVKWICYDQKIPPITKLYFPNFWRRQYMKVFTWLNNRSIKGADEYWDVTEREQKPRWTEKIELSDEFREHIKAQKLLQFGNKDISSDYALYLGRTTDYKNYNKLKDIFRELKIFLIHPENVTDDVIQALLSNAKMLVTASLWEGYGRPVMEAEALGIPAVAYDVGAHKRHIKKGICVHLDIDNMEKSEENFKKAVLEVWKR